MGKRKEKSDVRGEERVKKGKKGRKREEKKKKEKKKMVGKDE